MNKKLKGSLILLLTAFIWGSAFVAQDAGGKYVGPFTFNSVKWIIGTVFLTPIMLLCKKEDSKGNKRPDPFPHKKELMGGIVCGILLFVSSSFQQTGISLYKDGEAAAGKSGFITALYIVLVPLLGFFLHKRVPVRAWIAIVTAVFGMYLLCIASSFTLSLADFLVFLCAVCFAVHILLVDKFSASANVIKFSVVQMTVCGILSIISMLIFETPTLKSISEGAFPLIYAGVFSGGIAYTLQIIGQKNTDPTLASVIMSLESVFAAITGAFFGERLSQREILGCALMFIAVITAQVDLKKPKIKNL